MRLSYLIVFSIFIGVLGVSGQAQARQSHGLFYYFFTPAEDDHDRHYMNEWKNAYDSDWEYRWSPRMWADDVEAAQGVIDGFYKSGILKDQYVDDGVPVIQVGQRFLDLSGRDQRRVVKFVAYAFDIDGFNNTGAMNIVLERECVPLGVYSQGKVQLH